MATSVTAFITELDSRYANAYTNTNKVAWVNDVEFGIYEDIFKEYRVQFYKRTKDVYQYSLPSGVLWSDVYSLWVKKKSYDKKSLRHLKNNYSYYYDESKINIYPVPDETDTEYVSGAGDITFKALEYSSGAGEITFASTTITTTGDSFVTAGFVVNNSIQISGCVTNTGNNTTAVITAVTASTMTFASGTFTAGDEDGVITIKTNCIYTSGHDFDGFTVGEYALVSGCTDETDNNKYARIAAVADDVLTFAEGTFTAQAESATVTIQEPTIKMVYRYRLTEKAVADIATDTLLLPRRFESIYYYYCYAQMALLNREFNEYNNYLELYNRTVSDYIEWYEERRDMVSDNILSDGWGTVYDTESDDDD